MLLKISLSKMTAQLFRDGIIVDGASKLMLLSHMLRVHQWLKNSLLFIPLVAAHAFLQSGVWLPLIVAFFSFSLCASAAYITNDLHDLESDRQHPRKVKRPFASGRVPIWIGALLAPGLLLCSLGLALLVGSAFLKCLVFYFGMTCAYSFVLKRIVMVDCLTLAMLYTLRIVAGAAAANIALSFWLLAFSVFLFLSLAFIKRYAELELHRFNSKGQDEKQTLQGRGYYTTDAALIQTLGLCAGYAAVLVLTFYLNSPDVLKLYPAHQVVWVTVPILLFWLSWVWLQATRGNMHDDPLIFAIKDKASWLAATAFVMVLAMGAIDGSCSLDHLIHVDQHAPTSP